ncbi:hypothetical protein O181_037972 [Austropuccinia psidii MF-1]|uniref:HbrB-like protein n=1 Tax=Austropuccinia psidii MF-1 TaxID=1389203 RepID=A0A9Q3DDU9_9BASI|nr:hypothetical protein [Austropuccinia psidii MF-1]
MNFSSISSSAKPVIRHITSSSTLSSLNNNNSNSINNNSNSNNINNSNNSNLMSITKQDLNGFSMLLNNNSSHTISSTDSNQVNTFGLSLRSGDVWSKVVLRVIPLFNGEGHKGFIEDLNEFVSQHIHKTIADSPSKSISKLNSDLNELFTAGISILNNKLQADNLSNNRLLIRILEVWHFFFTAVLPYLEAIFLPLMTDQDLMSVIESKNNKVLQERLQQQHLLQQATTNTSLLASSSSSLLRPNSRNLQTQPRHRSATNQLTKSDETLQEIDIRRLALAAFRDHLILPIFPRLYLLFSLLYDPSLSHKHSILNLSPEIQSEQIHFKRLQMIGLLCSVQSDDSKQSSMEEFSKLIRLGKSNFDLLKLPANVTLSLSNRLNHNHSTSNLNNFHSPNHLNYSNRDNEPIRDSNQSSSSQSNQDLVNLNHRSKTIDSQEYDQDRPLAEIINLESPNQIKGWNKNRDFTRRSIRRQLGRNGSRKTQIIKSDQTSQSINDGNDSTLTKEKMIDEDSLKHAHLRQHPTIAHTAKLEDEEHSLEQLSDHPSPNLDQKDSSFHPIRFGTSTSKIGSSSSTASSPSLMIHHFTLFNYNRQIPKSNPHNLPDLTQLNWLS